MKKAKKRLLYFGVPALLIIILIIWSSSSKPDVEYTTVAPVYGSLLQTVSETGTVKPIKELSLNFLNVGRIEDVFVSVGDEVLAGDMLASLDSSSLVLRRQEAEAALSIAQANYSKMLSGASSEAINIARRNLEQAQAAEQSARLDLEKTITSVAESVRQAEKTYQDLVAVSPSVLPPARQAVVSAEVALSNTKSSSEKNIENTKGSLVLALSDKLLTVRVGMNNVTKIFDDENAKNVLSAKNFIYKSETENAKNRVLASLPEFEDLLSKARTSGDSSELLQASNLLASILFNAANVFDLSYLMLENSVVSSSFTQAHLDNYKALMISESAKVSAAANAIEAATQAYRGAILSYDTSVSAAQSSLDQAKNSLQNAITNASNALNNARLSAEQQHLAAASRVDNASKQVAVARAQYDNTVAPASAQDRQLALAQVSQAQAALDNIDKQIEDMSLLAPMDGIITAVNFRAGEQFGSAGLPMVRMLVDNSFEIEVDIAESNISKVRVGNSVEITLDAFSDDIKLEGFVSFIEPAQTLIGGVVYYRVTIEFSDIAELSAILEANELSLKSGMTANAVITTESKDDVLSVPSRAIVERNGSRVVRVLRGDDYEEVFVEVGLRGDNGLTEIRGEITENDEVVTFIREK